MACALRAQAGWACAGACRKASASRRPLSRVNAQQQDGNKLQATGYIAEDNSGRGNIFPTRQQAYIKQGTDTVASSGLGGIQGAGILAVALAAVAAATVLTSKSDGPESLATVASTFEGDGLVAIASRINASL